MAARGSPPSGGAAGPDDFVAAVRDGGAVPATIAVVECPHAPACPGCVAIGRPLADSLREKTARAAKWKGRLPDGEVVGKISDTLETVLAGVEILSDEVNRRYVAVISAEQAALLPGIQLVS